MARNYVIQLCVPVSIVISFLFLGCAASYPRKNETRGKAVSISTAPARSELENATYSGFEGIEEIKGPVRLIDGKWEGPPYTKDSAVRPVLNLFGDFIITGDLDGDGSDESVTVLNLSTGGTGQLRYIAVVSRISGAVQNVGTKFIAPAWGVKVTNGSVAQNLPLVMLRPRRLEFAESGDPLLGVTAYSSSFRCLLNRTRDVQDTSLALPDGPARAVFPRPNFRNLLELSYGSQ